MSIFLLPTSIKDDLRFLRRINAHEFRRWTVMMGLCAEHDGVIPASTVRDLGWKFHMSAKKLALMLDKFESPEIALIERQPDGSIVMCDFRSMNADVRIVPRAMTGAERKQKERAAKANGSQNGVTKIVTRRVTNSNYQSRNGHAPSRTGETLTFSGVLAKPNTPPLQTLNVGGAGNLTSLFFEDKSSAIGAVVELTGDRKSIRRWGQLWDQCDEHHLLGLFEEVYFSTAAHLDREPDANGGQYFNGTLGDLLRERGVMVSAGTAEERQAVAAELDHIKQALAADTSVDDDNGEAENVTQNVTSLPPPKAAPVTHSPAKSTPEPRPNVGSDIKAAWFNLSQTDRKKRHEAATAALRDRGDSTDPLTVQALAQQTYWDELQAKDGAAV